MGSAGASVSITDFSNEGASVLFAGMQLLKRTSRIVPIKR